MDRAADPRRNHPGYRGVYPRPWLYTARVIPANGTPHYSYNNEVYSLSDKYDIPGQWQAICFVILPASLKIYVAVVLGYSWGRRIVTQFEIFGYINQARLWTPVQQGADTTGILNPLPVRVPHNIREAWDRVAQAHTAAQYDRATMHHNNVSRWTEG